MKLWRIITSLLLLGAVALAVFLVSTWFRPPIFKPPTLPADWDPGCPQLVTEWLQVAIPEGSNESVMLRELSPNSLTLYRRQPGGPARFLDIYERYDLLTGALLATSSPLPGSSFTAARTPTELIHLFSPPFVPHPRVIWMDRQTLEFVRDEEIDSNTFPEPLHGKQLALRALQVLEDGAFAGIFSVAPPSTQNNSYWWRLDSNLHPIGEPISFAPEYNWWSYDQDGSRYFIGRGAARGHPNVDHVAILAATGQQTELPSRAWAYANSTGGPRISEVLPGRVPLSLVSMRWQVRVDPELSVPRVFGPDLAPSRNWFEALNDRTAASRLKRWRVDLGDDAVLDLIRESVRLDGLVFRDDRPDATVPAIPLSAEVVQAAQATFYQQDARLQSNVRLTDADFHPSKLGYSSSGVRVATMPSGEFLVFQTVDPVPKALAPGGITRYGLLDTATGDVDWIGWVANQLPPNDNPYRNTTSCARIGDTLVFYNMGMGGGTQLPGNGYRPLGFATILLPPELQGMPEGLSW